MTDEEFRSIVSRAMLAPSTHNTQPARWSLSEGTITVSADLSRRLPVGDPNDRDLQISIGAAVEGTQLALSLLARGAKVTWLDTPASTNIKPYARIEPTGTAKPSDPALAYVVQKRMTHRAGFEPVATSLETLQSAHCLVVDERAQVDWLCKHIDIASASVMKEKAFRDELLAWMRLSERDPGYERDGLNREALAMDRLTAAVTRPVLGTPIYDVLSALGLGPALTGEAARSKAGGAIVLFHWPKDGSYLEAGRAFYRLWLKATQLGLAGWPAAALADDDATRRAVETRFEVPRNHRLINSLRLGHAKGASPSRSRLSVDEVII